MSNRRYAADSKAGPLTYKSRIGLPNGLAECLCHAPLIDPIWSARDHEHVKVAIEGPENERLGDLGHGASNGICSFPRTPRRGG